MEYEVYLNNIECPFALSDNEMMELIKSSGIDESEYDFCKEGENPLRMGPLFESSGDNVANLPYYDEIAVIPGDIITISSDDKYKVIEENYLLSALFRDSCDLYFIVTSRCFINGVILLDVSIAKDNEQCLRWLRQNHYL